MSIRGFAIVALAFGIVPIPLPRSHRRASRTKLM
jgi:hypothetical protein